LPGRTLRSSLFILPIGAWFGVLLSCHLGRA
jgi:hypothetical protein